MHRTIVTDKEGRWRPLREAAEAEKAMRRGRERRRWVCRRSIVSATSARHK